MTCLRCCAVLLLVLFTALVARSAVLRNHPQTIVQPDGSLVQCYASGDEFHHWLHDAQNFTIVQDPRTGYFVYAALENETLSPTSFVVSTVDPEAVGLTRGANISVAAIQEKREKVLARTAMGSMAAGTVGTINNIVIFIRFADESAAVFPDRIVTYDKMFNSPIVGANSMFNYYRQVSNSQLTILSTFYPSTSDSVLSYADAHPRNYYRKYNAVTNPSGYASGDDAWSREQTLLANAVRAVSSLIPVGLTIDSNGDGYVDNVCFVISGGVEAWADLLWPHMTSLSMDRVPINGKVVGVYNFQLRNALLDPGNMVYVLAHEMFHSLGAPDLYHYTSQPVDPVGAWDIMDYSANPPVHMSAYMKWKYGGWFNSIPTIDTPGTYRLAPLVFSPTYCFRIPSIYSAKEFFVVEYRKRIGAFERSLPGEGLLVYRINPDFNGNANGPPDEVYLYRPGGTTTANGALSSAAMSADAGWTALTDSTMPSSFLTDGSPGGLRLTGVGYVGDTLSFTIDFPRVPIIALSTRAIYFEPIGDVSDRFDTSFIVRNTGFAPDSVTTSIGPGNVTPDSAIAVHPGSFALAPRDSQKVTVSIRPHLLSAGYYSAMVLVNSRFGIGQKAFSMVMDFEKITTGVEKTRGVPREFALEQNYPNPFNPTTVVSCQLPVVSNVKVAIYDALGREVATLLDEVKQPGAYSVTWNASQHASGVYYCRMTARKTDGGQAGGFDKTRTMILVK